MMLTMMVAHDEHDDGVPAFISATLPHSINGFGFAHGRDDEHDGCVMMSMIKMEDGR